IGAMTLITERQKIPDKSFVTGIPGKIKKELTEKVFEWVERDDNSLYAKMAQMYKEGEGY
ncbi:MAG: gamma carbonic anhydrase family protein, partial [Chloroflexi bacterium]|nr:gamma carbonic anhydrase family protein [Chloroflexota bacterium]